MAGLTTRPVSRSPNPSPTGLTFVSANSSTAYDATTGVWTVGDLASGATVDQEIVATVTGTAAVVNDAEVTASDQADPDSTPGNGAAADEDDDASITVTGQLVADLSLEMTVDDATPPIGTVVRFTFIDFVYVIWLGCRQRGRRHG